MRNINPLYLLLKYRLAARCGEARASRTIPRESLVIAGHILELTLALYTRLLGARPEFAWFSSRAAREATLQRDELLERVSARLNTSAGGSKPHLGQLSPGCLHCIEGDWACNFINRLCNRDCFFCKRSHRRLREEPESETWGFFFTEPSQHLRYLRNFRIKGVSFSGGEPLLVRNRLLNNIRAVRREFSDSIHIWMYSNGDFADREVLEELREAGLDEIRFNIAARDYDFSPAVLAREYIRTVTIEIPCIPEDYQRLVELLPAMEEAGIDFLNLHQLSVEEQNCRELIRRPYHFTGVYPGLSVFESELCALRLLDHALERGLTLPINYCSSIYKNRYQGRGFRKQRAAAFPQGYETLTEGGYLRRVSVSARETLLRNLAEKLAEVPEARGLWSLDAGAQLLFLDPGLVRFVDWTASKVRISYLRPGVLPGPGGGKLEPDNLVENKVVVAETGDLDPGLYRLWYSLYIAGEARQPALAAFARSGRGGNGNRVDLDLILGMKAYERMPEGFPEIS